MIKKFLSYRVSVTG